jgi:hypothetical protein
MFLVSGLSEALILAPFCLSRQDFKMKNYRHLSLDGYDIAASRRIVRNLGVCRMVSAGNRRPRIKGLISPLSVKDRSRENSKKAWVISTDV